MQCTDTSAHYPLFTEPQNRFYLGVDVLPTTTASTAEACAGACNADPLCECCCLYRGMGPSPMQHSPRRRTRWAHPAGGASLQMMHCRAQYKQRSAPPRSRPSGNFWSLCPPAVGAAGCEVPSFTPNASPQIVPAGYCLLSWDAGTDRLAFFKM